MAFARIPEPAQFSASALLAPASSADDSENIEIKFANIVFFETPPGFSMPLLFAHRDPSMPRPHPLAARSTTHHQAAPTQHSLRMLAAGLLLAAFWFGWQAWL